MGSSHVEQRKNPIHQDQYTDTKTVTVEPEETQRSVSYQASTPEMQEYIQKNIIEPTQKAYGINPDTGEVTPFQALGYNPEDERKRREAEMALNDRKRKENAWYNAFAVVGDSLSAALGGNVWQRQPNRIGEKANADNQRLIAEQKAEDMNNAAMLRNAGVKYADAVNRLIQNYLTKTTTTNKTGGSRVEQTVHGPQDGYRYTSHVVSDGNSGKGSGSGGGSAKIMNINTGSKQNGNFKQNGYEIPKNQYDAIQGLLMAHYQKLLNERDADGNLTRKAEDFRNKLITAGVLNKSVAGSLSPIEQNSFVPDMIMRNGNYWGIDQAMADRIEKETGGKIKFKVKNGWGVVPQQQGPPYDF